MKREVEFARGLSKKVIPIWIEDCPLPSTFADRDVIDFRPRTRAERRFDISRILKYAPAELIGREDETKLLNDAWAEDAPTAKKAARTSSPSSPSAAKGKPRSSPSGPPNSPRRTGPAATPPLRGPSTARARASNWPLPPTCSSRKPSPSSATTRTKQFAASPAGAFEKGQRLARIVGQRRSLLILDGLEPLQYAPTSPTPGQLKDQGIAALLKGLAAASHGLCVVTTRYSLPDLKAFWQTTAPEVKLLRLSRDAGVHLLKTLGVRRHGARNSRRWSKT